MKSLMGRFLICLLSAMVGLFLCLVAKACGPHFPRGYVWQQSGERILEMPALNFRMAIEALIGRDSSDEVMESRDTRWLWDDTQVADRYDLQEALVRIGVPQAEREALSEAFVEMRDTMRKAMYPVLRHRYRYEGVVPKEVSESNFIDAFALFPGEQYTDLLSGIPEEFASCLKSDSVQTWLDAEQAQSDVRALSVSLESKDDDAEAVLQTVLDYAKMRRVMRFHAEASLHPMLTGADPFPFYEYAPLLAALPEEFARYAIGAWHYECGYYEAAIAQFSALLDLPPSTRQFRSVWAAYMLGLSWTHLDTKQSVPFFEMTRSLAATGFSDATGLAETSLNIQCLAEQFDGRFAFALDHYLTELRSGTWAKEEWHYDALRAICADILEADPIPEYVYRNPEFLQVLACYASAHDGGRDGADLLVGIRSAQLDGPPKNLGRFACAAYNKGLMEQAADWIAVADENDPHALWTAAKLAQRDGKLERSEVLLSKVDAQLSHEDGGAARRAVDSVTEMHNHVLGDLGVARLNVRHYSRSLDAFTRGGFQEDSAYVADRVLTKSELSRFVEQYNDDPVYASFSMPFPIPSLRYTLARRYARDGDLSKAISLYPTKFKGPYHHRELRAQEETLPALIERYTTQLKIGRNHSESRENRATALMESASIARDYGLELFGTEYTPDNFMYGGSFPIVLTPRAESSMATVNERWRVSQHAPSIERRYHYRWHAAELMWEAAALLPDNDPQTARALWQGGKWIALSDPLGADRFYKALVNRCRKLPIGQAADAQRWFPEKPDDW